MLAGLTLGEQDQLRSLLDKGGAVCGGLESLIADLRVTAGEGSFSRELPAGRSISNIGSGAGWVDRTKVFVAFG